MRDCELDLSWGPARHEGPESAAVTGVPNRWSKRGSPQRPRSAQSQARRATTAARGRASATRPGPSALRSARAFARAPHRSARRRGTRIARPSAPMNPANSEERQAIKIARASGAIVDAKIEGERRGLDRQADHQDQGSRQQPRRAIRRSSPPSGSRLPQRRRRSRSRGPRAADRQSPARSLRLWEGHQCNADRRQRDRRNQRNGRRIVERDEAEERDLRRLGLGVGDGDHEAAGCASPPASWRSRSLARPRRTPPRRELGAVKRGAGRPVMARRPREELPPRRAIRTENATAPRRLLRARR